MENNILLTAIERILDYANDLKNEKEDDYIMGKKVAYYEVLSVIQREIDEREVPLDKYHMDFDVDKFF